MATIGFYLDTRRVKSDNRYPIKIRVRHNGKFLVNTGYSSNENGWSGNEYTKEENNFRAKNVVLRAMLNKVENFLLALERDGKLKEMSDRILQDKIKNEIENKCSKSEKCFIDYIQEFISETKTKKGTIDCYQGTINKIREYDECCTFVTIDKHWLSNFENWMAQTMKINAYAIHLRNVRAVFNYAIDEEYTLLYPFRKFKIKKEETRKRSLTVEQLVVLRDYPCEKHQERYRDIFILMFYLIGVNAVDLFNAKNLVNGRLEYKRAKTGKLYSIKVEPEAMAIIEKYRGENYLLNVLDDYSNYKDFLHRMGIELKNIGEVKRVGLGGKKERTPLFPELSSYWARHSWATTAAELDIPKETISEALGHEIGSAVTSIYIKFDRKKVDVANRKVIDCLFRQDRERE